MKPRDFIISQIEHRETKPVPYTFNYEDVVGKKLDEYYGSNDWSKTIKNYMQTCITIDTLQEVSISDVYAKDGFGSIWRKDRRPWHLEHPVLAEATFKGYRFPSTSQFTEPIHMNKEEAITKIENNSDVFHVIGM